MGDPGWILSVPGSSFRCDVWGLNQQMEDLSLLSLALTVAFIKRTLFKRTEYVSFKDPENAELATETRDF